jgi:hypothetical protein
MINHYEFDNANLDGDKEAVIIPNPPTLINKLSANETNNFKDKINEVIDAINPLSPIQYLELRLKFKGVVGGTPNTGPGLQVGDIVHGFADANTIWTNARYEWGDINNRANYTPLYEPKPAPQLFTALTTGINQTFILNPVFVAGSVLKSKGELFKTTEWTQTGDVITILVNTNTGNSIYVKP